MILVHFSHFLIQPRAKKCCTDSKVVIGFGGSSIVIVNLDVSAVPLLINVRGIIASV